MAGPVPNPENGGCDCMRTESVMFFTEHEEEFANLLIRLGIRKNIAKVLVYLANIGEVSTRQVERGTDLRQPEVSLAMRYLLDRDWVSSYQSHRSSQGRPVKIYNLAKPIADIIGVIEDEKQQEVLQQIKLTKKLREYVC